MKIKIGNGNWIEPTEDTPIAIRVTEKDKQLFADVKNKDDVTVIGFFHDDDQTPTDKKIEWMKE